MCERSSATDINPDFVRRTLTASLSIPLEHRTEQLRSLISDCREHLHRLERCKARQLPAEVILHILRYVNANKDLKAASHVCRSWSAEARKVLWSAMSLVCFSELAERMCFHKIHKQSPHSLPNNLAVTEITLSFSRLLGLCADVESVWELWGNPHTVRSLYFVDDMSFEQWSLARLLLSQFTNLSVCELPSEQRKISFEPYKSASPRFAHFDRVSPRRECV
ncbi:hypothetical protein M427DRAFT_408823 [Gonapodya prolifera JEL478]|uniref:F-box domain-containing protein n=1 Tax=Gonapodya prolifera (strain JEL478) TaxID=1344416 RepID=A0A139A621_GONPJ|nr:hypothetical protein M427DRAFT_408823 [Gonapodya prolifera JEL478]|eukprot:KXS12201.1 hypothetical protein M427DRAFT_408823 [Gonapodya prolifera JEL478]